MRFNISLNRISWLRPFDYKKVIIVAFLIRLICASVYDITVSVTGRDALLPDSSYYTAYAHYLTTLLRGFNTDQIRKCVMQMNKAYKTQFLDAYRRLSGYRFPAKSESSVFVYISGGIYFMFGPFTIVIRILNIFMSIASAYFMFKVAKRQFGDLTANLFLTIALFLPTLFGYSIMICRDVARAFVISFFLYLIYGGVICLRGKKISLSF